MFIIWLTQLLFPNHRSCGIKELCANHNIECKNCDGSNYKEKEAIK